MSQNKSNLIELKFARCKPRVCRSFTLLAVGALLSACASAPSPTTPAPETSLVQEVDALPAPEGEGEVIGEELLAGFVTEEGAPVTEDPAIRVLTDAEFAALTAAEPAPPEPEKRTGLFGFLRGSDAAQDPAPLPTVVSVADSETGVPLSEEVTEPAVITAALPQPEQPQSEKRRGLGGLFSMRAEASVPEPGFDIGADGPLAFGEVVRVCGVPKRKMGAEVARSAGSGNYRLFDTEPVSTLQRAQFVTGFSDGCARRFTGALAMFGSFDVHEAKRYDTLNTSSYSQVDLAYEKVKSRICGVRRGKACPESKAERLNREVAFVTVYPAFGSTGRWMELLLHKGDLVAFNTIDP